MSDDSEITTDHENGFVDGTVDLENHGSLLVQVSQIVTEVSGQQVSGYDESLSDLGLDSVVLLEVFAVLEATFNLDLTENVISEFRSVRRIARVVRDSLRTNIKA